MVLFCKYTPFNDENLFFRAPLSADILEFNEGCLESANLFRDLINSYQGSLLDLSATVIHLELDIKNGLKNFNDEVIFE